jgi:hypothetical protein
MWRHGTGKIWRYSIGCGLHNTRILSWRRGRIAVGDVANKYNVRAKTSAKTSKSRSVTRGRSCDRVRKCQRRCGRIVQGQSVVWNELESFNYGKRLVIYIHLQQILICYTACLQAPFISGYSIDISACSTIVSNINHPAEPLEMILIRR